jgi:hypothetical protein
LLFLRRYRVVVLLDSGRGFLRYSCILFRQRYCNIDFPTVHETCTVHIHSYSLPIPGANSFPSNELDGIIVSSRGLHDIILQRSGSLRLQYFSPSISISCTNSFILIASAYERLKHPQRLTFLIGKPDNRRHFRPSIRIAVESSENFKLKNSRLHRSGSLWEGPLFPSAARTTFCGKYCVMKRMVRIFGKESNFRGQ